jgi:hypothetical protein
LGWTDEKGQLGQENLYRTPGTGPPEKTVRMGQAGQEGNDRVAIM